MIKAIVNALDDDDDISTPLSLRKKFKKKKFRMNFVERVCVGIAAIYFGLIVWIVSHRPKIFLKKVARTHRLLGFSYFSLLFLGFLDAAFNASSDVVVVVVVRFLYDFFLGLMGAWLAWSAQEFPRPARQQHTASGVLDPHATVLPSEMREHAFFQLLNASHSLLLHILSWLPTDTTGSIFFLRIFFLWVFGFGPWIWRDRFPTHSFSANYSGMSIDPKSTPWTRFLYRVKKWQFVALKHYLQNALLLVVTFFLTSSPSSSSRPPHSLSFRLHFMFVSTSFVMEFFMQSLVRASMLSQTSMLALHVLLMTGASLAAANALFFFAIPLMMWGTLSMCINFANRKHDPFNGALLISIASVARMVMS